MDYKQKYEQALERAKGLYNSIFVNNDILEQIFPELLKENENYDEKIRNALINRFNESGELDGIPYDDIRIWLEKQGKVKHTCRNCQTFQDLHQNCPYSPIYQYTDLTDAHKHLDDETHCEFWLEKQGEQKSTWSEEDELNFNQAIYVCHQYGYLGVEIWLKSFRKRIIDVI